MTRKNEQMADQPHERDFEIEPLEERIAPSAGIFPYELQIGAHQGPWTQTGDGLVFLGHDPV